jgi:hypothetical protein
MINRMNKACRPRPTISLSDQAARLTLPQPPLRTSSLYLPSTTTTTFTLHSSSSSFSHLPLSAFPPRRLPFNLPVIIPFFSSSLFVQLPGRGDPLNTQLPIFFQLVLLACLLLLLLPRLFLNVATSLTLISYQRPRSDFLNTKQVLYFRSVDFSFLLFARSGSTCYLASW